MKEVDQYKRESELYRRRSARKRRAIEEKLRDDKIPANQNINEAAYYIRYAVACYSWPYYVYMHNVRGCRELFCNTKPSCACCQSSSTCCRCCSFCCPKKTTATSVSSNSSSSSSSSREADEANRESIEAGQFMNGQIPVSKLTVHGDTRSMRYFRAFKFLAKINEADLVYANFQNELFLVPFCIVVDHTKRTVVVCIRGSLSLQDAIVDMTAECEFHDVEGTGFTHQPFHKGILNTTENILARIKSLNLLEEAFRNNPVRDLEISLSSSFL